MFQVQDVISSNKSIRRSFSFPIHVQHLTVHLENRQRVYVTEQNVIQRALESPKLH